MSNQINLIPEGTKVWDVVFCREVVLEYTSTLKKNMLILPVLLPEYPYFIDKESTTIDGRYVNEPRNPRYSLTEFDYVNNTGKFTLLSYENYLALKKEEDAKKEEEALLPVGTEVWSIEKQQWLRIERVDERPDVVYPIKCNNSLSYTRDGKSGESQKIYSLSLTKYNWATGEGVFTPISAYNEIKNFPPSGTPVFHIPSQQWFTIGYITGNDDSSKLMAAYNTLYPISLFDENFDSVDTCTEEGYIDCTNEVPELSLTEFNYLKGTGKFTPITEWRTINS